MFRYLSVRSLRPSVGRRLASTVRDLEPSLDALESALRGGMTVTEVVSAEVVRIPAVNGVGIGSQVELGSSGKGVVIHFDRTLATVAIQEGSPRRGELVSVAEGKFRFAISPVKFSAEAPTAHNPLSTVPVVDMLFPGCVLEGSTVAVYGVKSPPACKNSSKLISFPSSSPSSGVQMYLDLITVANRALLDSATIPTTLVLRLNGIESIFSSLEFQAGHPLPIAPKSLIEAILQLSHKPAPGSSAGLSVVASFDSVGDFSKEFQASVDVGIELAGDGSVGNLESLLTRFSPRQKDNALVARIASGFAARKSLIAQQELGLTVDYWDKEELDSFETLLKLLGMVAPLHAVSSPPERRLLERSLTVLFFNKTSRSDAIALSRFGPDLIKLFHEEESELMKDIESSGSRLDSALLRHRFNFQVTNPIV